MISVSSVRIHSEIASHKHPRYDGSDRGFSARGRRAIGEFTATLVKGESLGQELKPDYEAICERTLNLPEMGRQSAEARRLIHVVSVQVNYKVAAIFTTERVSIYIDL